MGTATVRPLPATERCPCCGGRGVQFAECAGVVEATPEPASFGADPDVDAMVAAFWDAAPDAEGERVRVRRACRWDGHAAAHRDW